MKSELSAYCRPCLPKCLSEMNTIQGPPELEGLVTRLGLPMSSPELPTLGGLDLP